MKINDFLSLFTLRPIERTLYEKLFYGGPAGVTRLAKLVGINRTSAYDLLRNLVQTGLVIQSLQTGVKTFQIQTPERLRQLLEEKEKNVLNAKTALHDLEQEYRKIKKITKPKFELFEGRTELQLMMKDLLLYRAITVKAYWPIKKMLELLTPEFMESFHNERVERNINLKVIWPQSQVPDLKKHPLLQSTIDLKREVRIAPESIDFSLGYTVYEDKVRFISSSKENFGFLVESRELAEMMESQFEVLWNSSKPLGK